ncbi:hypothetical protein F5Y00DRAFT_270249 [Daldinia vernicosa]|uniref:uncharacterized protein n=1 Tax=Daldinia vernicosa TaxID=114800 RepID=UPI002007D6B9|nr:uncharacterized protein F5Y00DRAFT_270249 [Daldinia vernicosa]KAI0848286.1 hypothetical protein F5Y00DRAFT_270249 [Daldinia vernicosa]
MSDATELSDDDLVELSLLRDFEVDELIRDGFLDESEQMTRPLDKELVFKYDELCLYITPGPLYPAASATWELESYELSRESVIELRTQLRQVVEAAAVTNNISKWNSRGESVYGAFEPTMAVYELANATRGYLKSWRERLPKKPKGRIRSNILPFEEKPANPIMTSSETAYHFLRQTPQEICSQIPSCYRVLHVEEVIRSDLAVRFYKKQTEIRERLSEYSVGTLHGCVPASLHHSKRKEVYLDHLVKPTMTFHGTQRQLVPSIVRYGFLKPGQKNPGTNEAHGVRCGSTYGRGIYSSPNADFSLSYTGSSCQATKPNEYFGIKLLVCATIMGRSADVYRDDNWRNQSQAYPGADSHVSNRGLEYIVFDSAQILPIYVIHIDWGHDNHEHFEELPSNPESFVPTNQTRHPKLLQGVRWPGDVQREKAAAFARAAKWFPYGYGPSTGSKFVVEEVGEVDEDEEEYGDYQALRGEEIKDKTNLNFWSWVKVGEEIDAVEGGGLENEYTKDRRWYYSSKTSEEMPNWDDIPSPEEEEEEGYVNLESIESDDDLGISRLMV